jgi:hypothetical protein
LSEKLKEIPDCQLFFKIYQHRQLLRIQRLVSENEAIGRYDVLPGLVGREVTTTNMTRPQMICCIGDQEAMDGEGLQVYPAKPKLCVPSVIKIANCQLFVPKRDSMEVKLIESMSRQFPAAKKSEIRVIQRQLRLGESIH